MPKGIRRIGVGAMLLGCALPLPAWAGSAQAALTVAVVVPARCAIRVPGSMTAQDGLAGGARETIAMRCTKGSLPGATGQAGGSVAGPRISRDVVTAAPVPIASASRQAEAGATTVTEAAGPRMVVTVNF
jgi:hypothetical protein